MSFTLIFSKKKFPNYRVCSQIRSVSVWWSFPSLPLWSLGNDSWSTPGVAFGKQCLFSIFSIAEFCFCRKCWNLARNQSATRSSLCPKKMMPLKSFALLYQVLLLSTFHWIGFCFTDQGNRFCDRANGLHHCWSEKDAHRVSYKLELESKFVFEIWRKITKLMRLFLDAKQSIEDLDFHFKILSKKAKESLHSKRLFFLLLKHF